MVVFVKYTLGDLQLTQGDFIIKTAKIRHNRIYYICDKQVFDLNLNWADINNNTTTLLSNFDVVHEMSVYQYILKRDRITFSAL